MQMPDVNVLVYAHRADDPDHDFYAEWLDTLVNGPSPFALSVLVAAAFVRVVTHPRFPQAPSSLEEALAFVDAVSSAPNCRMVGAGATSWPIARDLCRGTYTYGPMVSDAHHAAVAIEHGCTLVSRDSDFQRFTPHGLLFKLLEPQSEGSTRTI